MFCCKNCLLPRLFLKKAGGRVVHRGGRAIFFSDTLWPSRAQFFIFSRVFFCFLVCIFSKIYSGNNFFSLSRFELFLALFSGIFNFLAQNLPFFSGNFCFFSLKKKHWGGAEWKGRGTYVITRGAGGRDKQEVFLKKSGGDK